MQRACTVSEGSAHRAETAAALYQFSAVVQRQRRTKYDLAGERSDEIACSGRTDELQRTAAPTHKCQPGNALATGSYQTHIKSRAHRPCTAPETFRLSSLSLSGRVWLMNASAVGVQITKSLTSLNSVADTLLRHPTVTLTLTLTKPIFTDNAPITTENKHTTYDVSCLRMSAISCVLSTESQKTIRYVSVVGELNYANTNTIHIWAYCTQE